VPLFPFFFLGRAYQLTRNFIAYNVCQSVKCLAIGKCERSEDTKPSNAGHLPKAEDGLCPPQHTLAVVGCKLAPTIMFISAADFCFGFARHLKYKEPCKSILHYISIIEKVRDTRPYKKPEKRIK
jgi:hypothetical protein